MVLEVGLGDAMRAWARTLPERHGGRRLLWALVVVLAVAFVARVVAALVGWDFRNGSDADMYERLAAQLFLDGEFGIAGSANPYDFAPGAPLFAAAVYNLIGDVSPVAARLGLAVAGTFGVLVVYLLGRRLAGPRAGLVAAGLAAVYPPTLFYTSLLSGEPLAILTVPGAVLAFLWAARPRPLAVGVGAARIAARAHRLPASRVPRADRAARRAGDRGRRPARRAVARRRGRRADGARLRASRSRRGRRSRRTIWGASSRSRPAAARRSSSAPTCPGDGLHERTKAHLYHRFRGIDPSPQELRQLPMNPVLDEVAKEYPQLGRDEALGRVGRENLIRWATDEPRAVAQMMAGKIAHMWHGAGSPSNTPAGGALHYLVLVAGFAGLVLLIVRRRWEVLPILVLLVGISLIGGLLLAGTRRNLPVMPLVMALAGVSLIAAFDWARVRASRKRVTETEAVESLLAPH